MLFPGSNFADLPLYPQGRGIKTDFGMLNPPGGRVVAYVHSSGAAGVRDSRLAKMVYTTLNAALALCESGKGDTVFVLPGHAENISSADQMSNLVAGTKIIGLGEGSQMPTFTWTAATATFLLDVANVVLEGLRLNVSPDSGTTTVAAPITVSAAGCAIRNCVWRTSVDANSLSTIPLTTTAAADDFEFSGNYMLGAVAGVQTTGIQFVGADRLRFFNNFISLATSGVAVGVVRFLTTASLDILMLKNVLKNSLAASTHALTGMSGVTGFIDQLEMAVNSGIAGANTLAEMHFGADCYVGDGGGTRAVSFGTAST
jgi:hypothetical protein